MNKVELNDLPQYSPWPARLLGLEAWTNSDRTIQKIESEYNLDKYEKCLDFYLSDTKIDSEKIRQFQYGSDNRKVCISLGNVLSEISLHEAIVKYSQLLLTKMQPQIEKCKTVVELGCGYGYNLWHLANHFDKEISWRGGEYSNNAIRLASLLYSKGTHHVEVEYFNFYDSKTYQMLAKANQPVVVFTSHAIEQLPNASTVFETLSVYRDKIQAVFHFEPVYELYDQTILGMLRRCYTKANDYNINLLSELQKRAYIKICDLETNVLGSNPLNPTSVIHWKFA